MCWRLTGTLIVLPGTVLVLVPGLMLYMTTGIPCATAVSGLHQIAFWGAVAAGCTGLGLALWTVTLFVRSGHGTPAPWDPPKQLVVKGPYRHVRNPMITGALLILLAESLILWSAMIAWWMLIFLVANALYFPFVEERGLEKRFGEDYRRYKRHVPRWIPRLQPWSG